MLLHVHDNFPVYLQKIDLFDEKIHRRDNLPSIFPITKTTKKMKFVGEKDTTYCNPSIVVQDFPRRKNIQAILLSNVNRTKGHTKIIEKSFSQVFSIHRYTYVLSENI